MKTTILIVIILSVVQSCGHKQKDKDYINLKPQEVAFDNEHKQCFSHEELSPISDSINTLFPKRLLDNHIIKREVIDTLNRHILYSRYKLFDNKAEDYFKPVCIDTYEFDNQAISYATDGEIGKILVNTPTRFNIIALSNEMIMKNKINNIGTLLDLIQKSDSFPKAEYEDNKPVYSMKETSWVSHFKKVPTRYGLLLKNIDGFDFDLFIMAEYDRTYYRPREEKDSLANESIKKFPPFLFYDWKDYAFLFLNLVI